MSNEGYSMPKMGGHGRNNHFHSGRSGYASSQSGQANQAAVSPPQSVTSGAWGNARLLSYPSIDPSRSPIDNASPWSASSEGMRSQVDLTRAMPLQLAPVENLSYAQLQQAAMLMQQQLILQNQLLHGQIAQQKQQQHQHYQLENMALQEQIKQQQLQLQEIHRQQQQQLQLQEQMKMQDQIAAHRQQQQQQQQRILSNSGDEGPPPQHHYQLQNQLNLQGPRSTAPPEEYRVDRTSGASLCSEEGSQDNHEDLGDEPLKKKRLCKIWGCGKLDKGRGYCKLHGGGKRCMRHGCLKASRGSSGLCISHGGGPRCIVPFCRKSARTVGGFCKGHGGGRKCKVRDCRKTARGEGELCCDHAIESATYSHRSGAESYTHNEGRWSDMASESSAHFGGGGAYSSHSSVHPDGYYSPSDNHKNDGRGGQGEEDEMDDDMHGHGDQPNRRGPNNRRKRYGASPIGAGFAAVQPINEHSAQPGTRFGYAYSAPTLRGSAMV